MTIDGRSPQSVLQPSSTDELSEALVQKKGSVVPIGGNTQQDFGNPLRSFDFAVDLTRLNRITEYVPADLTIHVEAGITLAELERALAAHDQFIPIDPWNGPSATLGGIVATNAQGPYRAIGTIRDWIIGMKVVEADGRVSKTGGRVVKNVTGYDLAKLYTGSLGSLAIVAEISLKVRAKYGRTVTAITRSPTVEAAGALLRDIRTSALQPVACEWVGPENEILLRFGEHPKAVDVQLKSLPPSDWKILDGDEEWGVWAALRERYARLGPTLLRVVGLPTNAVHIVTEYPSNGWIAHAMNGIVLLEISDEEQIDRIRSKYRAVIERASLEVRSRIPTFGLNEAEFELMRKMKRAFDPTGRLNPGRHVDGEFHGKDLDG